MYLNLVTYQKDMKNLLLLFLLTILSFEAKSDTNIVNLDQLNNAIKNGPNNKVGFLSYPNFESVEGFLDKNVVPKIFKDVTDLELAVIEEDVIAGEFKMISFFHGKFSA